MDLIGPGLENHVDRRTTPPELGAHRVLFRAKFLDGIRWRQCDGASQAEFVVVYAIQ